MKIEETQQEKKKSLYKTWNFAKSDESWLSKGDTTLGGTGNQEGGEVKWRLCPNSGPASFEGPGLPESISSPQFTGQIFGEASAQFNLKRFSTFGFTPPNRPYFNRKLN